MIELIDGDIVVYKIAFGYESSPSSVVPVGLRKYLDRLHKKFDGEHEIYLSSVGDKTLFRNEIATIKGYKANRATKTKPAYYDFVRELLVNEHGATVVEGIEADDMLAIRQTDLDDSCVCISNDKDLLQVPGYHYDPVKYVLRYVDVQQANRHFWDQMIIGDATDNIQGLPGYGNSSIKYVYKGCKTYDELFKACLTEYVDQGQVGNFVEMADLLWLMRAPDMKWSDYNCNQELLRGIL